MGRELVRFDWAMKRLLRNKADYVVVEGLLTCLLERPIKIKSLLESEGNKDRDDAKQNRVDNARSLKAHGVPLEVIIKSLGFIDAEAA